MRKFNWDEFKNKDNKIAVHCKTEEEAVDFCKQMHEHGMKWTVVLVIWTIRIIVYTEKELVI